MEDVDPKELSESTITEEDNHGINWIYKVASPSSRYGLVEDVDPKELSESSMVWANKDAIAMPDSNQIFYVWKDYHINPHPQQNLMTT